MKKLGISLVAALAILPFAANATPVTGEPAHADPATVASAAPGYALAEAEGNDGNLATAGYVKGAYNAAIKAINKVATTAGSAVKGVQVNGADLGQDANGKVNVTIAEGSTNGTIKVNNVDVAVHGVLTDASAFDASGAAATAEQNAKDYADGLASNYDASGAAATAEQNAKDYADGLASNYDASGAAATAEQNAKDYADGLASNYATAAQGALAATALQSGDNVSALNNDAGYLTSANLTDYAKKTGVTQTITNSTIAGTVPVVATWGSNTASTVAITANITGATYAEPANP